MSPCDCHHRADGDIFVADGHSGQSDNPPPDANGRIVKFTKDGKYVKEWGKIGSRPGEFRTPHALAFDSKGVLPSPTAEPPHPDLRQDGKVLGDGSNFSRVSGLFIDKNDRPVCDRFESSAARPPGPEEPASDWQHQRRQGARLIRRTRIQKPRAPQAKAWRWIRRQRVAAEGPNLPARRRRRLDDST